MIGALITRRPFLLLLFFFLLYFGAFAFVLPPPPQKQFHAIVLDERIRYQPMVRYSIHTIVVAHEYINCFHDTLRSLWPIGTIFSFNFNLIAIYFH